MTYRTISDNLTHMTLTLSTIDYAWRHCRYAKTHTLHSFMKAHLPTPCQQLPKEVTIGTFSSTLHRPSPQGQPWTLQVWPWGDPRSTLTSLCPGCWRQGDLHTVGSWAVTHLWRLDVRWSCKNDILLLGVFSKQNFPKHQCLRCSEVLQLYTWKTVFDPVTGDEFLEALLQNSHALEGLDTPTLHVAFYQDLTWFAFQGLFKWNAVFPTMATTVVDCPIILQSKSIRLVAGMWKPRMFGQISSETLFLRTVSAKSLVHLCQIVLDLLY